MATCREGETGHRITAVTTREGKEKTQSRTRLKSSRMLSTKGFPGAHILSQLNPKPRIFFQTKRGTAQSHQEISCLCQQAKIQPSTTYVYQRSTNYASKSWNLTPPHQNICRSGSGLYKQQLLSGQGKWSSHDLHPQGSV